MHYPKKLTGLEFCLAIGCPLNCHYCPQKLLISRYQELYPKTEMMMTFDTFEKCLGQVEEGCGITFCGMVEPFKNPECARMIKYAYDKGYKVTLFSTFVGMSEEDIELLKDVKFEDLTLHIPDKEGNMKVQFTEQYMSVMDMAYRKLQITGYSCHGNVHSQIEKYVKRQLLVHSELSDRAGNLTDTEYLPTYNEGNIVCNVGLSAKGAGGWVPTVLPNGNLALCCMDYGLKHPLGNLLENSYEDIVKGDEFQKFINGLFDKNDTLCRTCSAAMSRAESTDEINMRSLNAICIGQRLENSDEIEDIPILKKLSEAKHVCVYGLGKLFNDNYFKSGWANVINADLLSDGDPQKWGKSYGGIECIRPEKLCDYPGLFVVIYVKNGDEIIKKLESMGIYNYVSAYDIYAALNQ